MILALRLERELDSTPVSLGTSGLKRAIQTAAIVGEALQIQPQIYSELNDLNNGLAAGKTHIEAQKIVLPQSQPILDWRPYPQAETWRDFFTRVTGFMEQFSASQESAALLVTHAANIQVIVAWWLGMDIDSRSQFEVSPASLSVLRYNRFGEPSVERLNDTAHLYQNGMPNPIRL